VRLAHKFAIESDNIRSDAVEVTEFPYLANKYRVTGVPLTVVNETTTISGARPEGRFVEEVLGAAGPSPTSG
jgi:predicted DsbA family dithiol-disulfide isomerase